MLFRSVIGGGAVIFVAAGLAGMAKAQEPRFFRIATGPTESDSFAVGTLIGSVVSSPPGSRECDRGGSCGVPGLVAVTQTTAGSIASIGQLSRKQLDSALAPADTVYWAQRALGPFARQAPLANLRAIAALYPQVLHIVVRRDAGISDLDGLRGKTLSLGERDSNTAATAQVVLQTAGLGESEVQVVFRKFGEAVEALREGRIDAVFTVAAAPAAPIAEFAQAADIDLLDVPPTVVEALRTLVPHYAPASIPAGTYRDVDAVETLGVGTMWLVTADTDDKTVYELARALLHPSNRKLLDQGNPLGRLIRPDTVLDGLTVELHPGAAQYYREAGLLKA